MIVGIGTEKDYDTFVSLNTFSKSNVLQCKILISINKTLYYLFFTYYRV